MSVTLTCESCTDPTPSVETAIKHVSANPGHVVSGEYEDGMTTHISTYTPADDEEAPPAPEPTQ